MNSNILKNMKNLVKLVGMRKSKYFQRQIKTKGKVRDAVSIFYVLCFMFYVLCFRIFNYDNPKF